MWNPIFYTSPPTAIVDAVPAGLRPRLCSVQNGWVGWGGNNAIFHTVDFYTPSEALVAGPPENAGYDFIDFAVINTGLAALSTSGVLYNADVGFGTVTPNVEFAGVSMTSIEHDAGGLLVYGTADGTIYRQDPGNPPQLIYTFQNPGPVVRIRRLPMGRLLAVCGTAFCVGDGASFTEYYRWDFSLITDVTLVTDGFGTDVAFSISGTSNDGVTAYFARAPSYDPTSTEGSSNPWYGGTLYVGAGAGAVVGVGAEGAYAFAGVIGDNMDAYYGLSPTTGNWAFQMGGSEAYAIGAPHVEYNEETSLFTSYGLVFSDGSVRLSRIDFQWQDPPAAPMDPPTLVQYDAHIAVSWAPYALWAAENFLLRRFDNTTGEWFTFPTFGPTDFFVADTNVIDGHNYCYYIRASRISGPSDTPPSTYQETLDGVNCIQFYLTKPINVDCYTAPGTEIAKLPFPDTPLSNFMTIDDRWTPLAPDPKNKAFATRDEHMVWHAYRLPIGVTTFRFVSTIIDFKTQDVVYRVWPSGKTIADADASLSQPEKPAPTNTLGWGGTIRDRRTLFNRPPSSGNH